MNILVTAALLYEIRDLITFSGAERYDRNQDVFRRSVNGCGIMFCRTRIGPRNVRLFYDRFKEYGLQTDLWLACGFAGALEGGLKVGDIVVCSGTVYTPGGKIEIKNTVHYNTLLKNLNSPGMKIYGMNAYSSPSFLGKKDKIRIAGMYPDAGFADMESCEIAKIAFEENIPLLIIRSVSDERNLVVPQIKKARSSLYKALSSLLTGLCSH